MAIKWLIDTAEFQSTRSARSATDIDVSFDGASDISIHAPPPVRVARATPRPAPAGPPPPINHPALGEAGHQAADFAKRHQAHISIHALREERDIIQQAITHCQRQFQSTRSARSATHDPHP